MRKLKLLIFFASMQLSAYAGPFGLEMGKSLQELQTIAKLEPTSQYSYKTASLPGGHPDFTDYRLLITPGQGLCKVTAWTDGISTSVYGTELLSAFERYSTALSKKYGATEAFNYLSRGSIWDEPKDWMMGLRKKERTLVSYWTNKKLELPDNIAAIKLEAVAVTTERGMISIGYEFTNATDCIDWVRTQKDSSL